MFYKPYTFDKTNLIIRKRLVPNIFPIKLKNKDGTENFIIQTPTMFIPFGLTKCKFSFKEYIDISFLNLNNYPNIDQFKTFIKTIETFLKKKFNHFQLKESLKKNDTFPPLLRLNFINKDILIFNEDNQKILTTDITKKTYGKFIIQLSHIWTNNTSKKFGINFNICQIKLFTNLTYLPQTLEFIDDNDSKTLTYKDKYFKYFDMHKKGVPIFAIKQKLTLDNLDPNIIDNPNKPFIDKPFIDKPFNKPFNKAVDNKSSITIPPPPPLPFQNTSNKLNLHNALFSQIKNNNRNKLKKVTKDQRKKKADTYKSHSLIIPNKIDIINGRNKLKKTKNNISLIYG